MTVEEHAVVTAVLASTSFGLWRKSGAALAWMAWTLGFVLDIARMLAR